MISTLRSPSRKAFLLAGSASLVLVLAACGGGSSSSSSATSSAPAAGGSSGTRVPVTLRSFSITMAKSTLKPGSYTFAAKNTASISHTLTIAGPGVDNKTTGTIPSGQSGTLTVTLKNGSYDFFCSLPGHKAAGMNLEVTVGSGGGSTAGGTSSSGSSSSSGGGWG
jgi:plastocyanin